jgi:non-ribosomal peptide synthetase component F
MTLVEFVEDLEAQGVELAVNGDRLRYHGEKNILTADVLSKLKERKAEIIALQRDRVNGPRLCPVSNGQAALWFLHQLAPDSPSYNVGFPIRIRSRLDVSAMQRALCALTDRHPSLRTTFPTRNGRPVQEIHPHRPPAFEAIESGHLTQEELVSAVSRAYSRPFQIDTGPLFRAQLFTSADDDHLLLLTVHHMVCDAWSLWMLLEELGTIYRMEHGGGPATLPPLTTTYADYVRWQRELLRGPDAERLWGYWKQKLDQLPTLNLPTDRPRPAVQSFKGASRSFQIGPELAAELKKLASSEGTTLYMVLLAAFKVLLHRYSDQNDIVVGSPTSGRTKRQFANIVGDFINTVLLRSSCDGDPTFRAFLAHVSQATLDALDHEAFPFSLLVERLAPSRASDRAPLFQVLFNFLKPQSFQEAIELWVAHKAADPIEWGGLALEPFPLFQQEGQVDLALEIAEGKTSLFGLFKYSSELFDASSIARMVGHFDTLLQGIVAKPESRLSELPLLTEGERHQLLIQWNDTHADFPRNTCIHRLFEAQAARTPNAIAAVCEGEALSYGRLEAEAEAIAARLRVLGVGPGVLVGLAVERSLAMLSALIGILKAGGAYVPLDPSHPPSRLKFILKDASIGWLVSERSVVSRLQFDGQAADGSRDGLVILRLTGAETATAAKQTVTPDDLAYVIYTSGSTGQPKGVQLCHRGVVNFLMSMARELGVTSRDIFLALTTLSFDIAVLELLLPITVGGRVVISSREAAIDPERIAALIEQSAVTVIQATPATWRMLIDSGWQGSSTLKILVGG